MTAPAAEVTRRRFGRFWPLVLGLPVLLGVPLLFWDEPPVPALPRKSVAREPLVLPSPVAPGPNGAPTQTLTVALMPHAADEPAPPAPAHPHPITPTHARIYRENNLLGALNGAVDVEDAPGLRRLLEQYREEYPEDPHALEAGYALIADCLEQPSNAAAERARRYYETETASTLRRYVRRLCLR